MAGAVAAPGANLWPYWQPADQDSDRRIDHGAWQALLDAYLVTAEDGRTLFHYDGVTSEDSDRLSAYIDRLAQQDPRNLTRAEQLAYWINLYNALTVRVVLEHPEEDSIRGMGGGLFSRGPWDDEVIRIAGQDLTLNDIEHRILRPIWQDHRIHYAVNCASVSCPNLALDAYTSTNAHRLMAQGERSYLNHPRGLHFDEDGMLWLSSIFEWYLEDFGGTRQALMRYLAEQRPDLADRLESFDGDIRYHYDWSLNDVSR